MVDLAHTISTDDPQSSEVASDKIKQLFLRADMPVAIVDAVMVANEGLGQVPVAVRSSATAEDLPDASFAGQQETFLNMQGKEALLDAVKQCWSSLWTARAITYRRRQNIAPDEVSLAVVVQTQIASEVSGVAFSLNPNNNSYDEAVINSNTMKCLPKMSILVNNLSLKTSRSVNRLTNILICLVSRWTRLWR
ncbi:MAG: hypothetical protein GY796_18770 [Chloroflexi bacterium]|nr:hypothetical protein [Chloroflexota bacterium]